MDAEAARRRLTILVENPLMKPNPSSERADEYHEGMNRTKLFFTVALLGLATCLTATAQDSESSVGGDAAAITKTAKTATYAVLTGDNVNVRTAASVEGGYPILKLNTGDLVEVVIEKYGWTRVRTNTPVFGRMFGFVRADMIAVDDADPTIGTVTRRTSFRAGNLTRKLKPAASFEALDPPLQAGMKLKLIELFKGSRPEDPGVWKVAVPKTQLAWINSSYLAPATDAQIAAAMPAPKPAETMEAVTEVAKADEHSMQEAAADTIEDVKTTPTEETMVATETETTSETVPAAEVEIEMTAEPATPDLATRLAGLDEAFRVMLKENIESAELELLQRQFAQIRTDPEASELQKANADSRMEILAMKIDVQDRIARIRSMRDQTRIDGENIDATRMAMDTRAPFDVVGRLNASVVFTGQNAMPLLFRLQDMAGGRTLAYVVPDERYDLAAWTGLSVGVIGEVRYDESLQLNVVKPRRIDLVSASTKATPKVTTTVEAVTESSDDPEDSTRVEAETESTED